MTNSPVLPTWYAWTWLVRNIFIADETVLHALVTEYGSVGQLVVALGGKYNCAPKFQPKDLKDEDIVVQHYHGDSNVRQNKSPRGVKLWWPLYQECLEQNIGGIRDWKDNIGNRYLKKLENTPVENCLYCGKAPDVEHHSKCPNKENNL